MSVDSSYIYTDVTAVSLYRKTNLYLSGIGSSLYIYAAESTKPLLRLPCLRGQKIYGIKHKSNNDRCFIVFGGKQFTIVIGPERDEDPFQFTRLFEPKVCDDWLHSALWGPSGSDTISVLTAHNVVQTYDINTQAEIQRHSSKNNSIMYSGLLMAMDDGVVVLAGTVYSEVIIHVSGEDEPLQRLQGHSGVIFSISCHPRKEMVVTTSDDRSVRVWKPSSLRLIPCTTTEYWRQNEFKCQYVLYGHLARVMRSSITENLIISVGEDSLICFWSHEGDLMKRVKRHQNSGIWSIEAHNDLILSGGGDGSVAAQYIHGVTAKDYHQSNIIDVKQGHDIGNPKQIAFSAKENIYVLSDTNRLLYYDVGERCVTNSLDQFDEKQVTSKFCAISVSPCRKMCAVFGNQPILTIFVELDHIQSKILVKEIGEGSDHDIQAAVWVGPSHLLVCTRGCKGIVMKVNETGVTYRCSLPLPIHCARSISCAAMDTKRNAIVIGDRTGGLYLCICISENQCTLKDYKLVHGKHGPTSITFRNNLVLTTGRDGTVTCFKIDGIELMPLGTSKITFNWVVKFLDVEKEIVCGFQNKDFLVFNMKCHEEIYRVKCGGGHRSWDVFYLQERIGTTTRTQIILKFIYIKNGKIHTDTTILPDVASFMIGNGSHCKDINCLKAIPLDGKIVFISGGEDTTLRVSILERDSAYQDHIIHKLLSSVKTLKLHPRHHKEYFVFTAGGRAQICVKLFKYDLNRESFSCDMTDLINYMIKGTDKERKGNKNWTSVSVDPEPETRIMDIDYVKHNDTFTIFAGCSDARLRVFKFKSNNKPTFKMINESTYPTTCILKTVCVNYMKYDILITGCSRGEIALWDVSKNKEENFLPFFTMRTNMSGINTIATFRIPDDKLLIASGGDDNAVHLRVMQLPDLSNLNSIVLIHSLELQIHHSSAITGLFFVDEYLFSTSIDQRITKYVWGLTDSRLVCRYSYQTFSDVSDIKGIEFISRNRKTINVCVFGKGVEVLEIPVEKVVS